MKIKQKQKLNKSAQVRALLNIGKTTEYIVKKVGCTNWLVNLIKVGGNPIAKPVKEVVEKVGGNPVPNFLRPVEDIINSPLHYSMGVQPIDAIEEWQLNYRLGNVVKYVARCNFKGAYLEDLKKAQWYLHREICRVRWDEVEKTNHE